MLPWLKRLGAIATVALVLVVTGFSLHSSDPLGIGAPAVAQTQGAVPGFSVGGSSDSERWRAIRRGLRGNVSIPNKRAGFMIQSEGENWRAARNGPLSIYGLWLMGGVLALLLVFYLVRGRIRIEAGFSGRLIERFNSIERFSHWLTATSFVVLGLTSITQSVAPATRNTRAHCALVSSTSGTFNASAASAFKFGVIAIFDP